VVIARGRDALDIAMVTTWGAAQLQAMTVWADEVGAAGAMESLVPFSSSTAPHECSRWCLDNKPEACCGLRHLSS
jgi:hypothetical protein